MARTLGDLAHAALTRLGDVEEVIWTADELSANVVWAYQTLARETKCFWDLHYSENVPGHFSYTHAWELAVIQETPGLFDWGQSNFTCEFELRLLNDRPIDERSRVGPCWITCPAEIPFLVAAGWNTSVPATDVLPDFVQQIDRGVWDTRAIEAMEPRGLSQLESRYLLTEGQVDGYLWELDGLHTIRKWRKPAALAELATIDGAWGICRDVDELSGDDVEGSWGISRRIPGHHPMGPEAFGTPRRPYLEGTNVRLEVYRTGREMTVATDLCELPDRYADGLIYSAIADALRRPGAGQDLKLSGYYQARWDRILARVTRRTRQMKKEQTHQMGGSSGATFHRPARPSLPWPYPAVSVR